MNMETLTLREGGIVLNGAENFLGTLTLEGGGLTINGNAGIGILTATEAGGTLTIKGALDLTGTSSMDYGTITGTGSLRIQEGAELSLSGEARLDGTAVTANGTLNLSGKEAGTISSLSGTGALSMNGGSLFISSATSSAGTFAGTLEGDGTLNISGKTTQCLQTGNADYNLAVRDGGILVLKGTVDTSTLNYNSITAGNNGILRVEATGSGSGNANTALNLNSIDFQSGSTTEFVYNLNQADPFGSAMITADSITIGDGAQFVLANMTGNTGLGTYDNLENVVLMTADLINGLDEGASLSIGTTGLFAVYYKDAVMSRDGNNIVLNATVQQENIFTPAADSYNAAAGSNLLWEARNNLDATSQLGQLMNAVSNMITGEAPESVRCIQSSGCRGGFYGQRPGHGPARRAERTNGMDTQPHQPDGRQPRLHQRRPPLLPHVDGRHGLLRPAGHQG